MVRTSAVVSCALSLAACVPVERVVVDAPAEIEHVALVELDADGRVTRATPIAPWARGAPLPLITSSARALVVGWSAALAPPPAAKEVSLRAAAPCEPALPAPEWAATWTNGGLGDAPSELPALTARWLFDRCPTGAPPVLDASWSCREARCAPRVARTGPCRVSVDLEACGAGSLEGFEAPDGTLCFDPARATLSCAEAPGRPEAVAAMTCERACALELFDRARAPAPFTLRSVALTALPQADLASDNVTGVQPELMNRGHAYDLAVDGARVFVSGPAEGSGFPRCEQRLDRPSSLRVFDAAQLDEIASATVGPCLGALGADPFGPGPVGVFIDEDGEWKLARFDADAKRVEARLIRGLSPVHTPPGFTVDRLLPIDARSELAVLFRPAEGGQASSVLTIHDARTLEQKWRTDLGVEHPGAGLRLDGDVLLTTIPAVRLVQSIDLEARQLAGRTHYTLAEGREHVAHDLFPLGADRVLVAQGSRKLVHLAQDGLHTTITPLSTDADLTRIERWPGDPALFLVAGTQRIDGRPLRDADVALYDAEHRRFLVGAWPVGGGIVSRVVTDTANRVFLLLPWSGAFVRLEPAP